MFVGEGRAGKTSALESLMDMPFRDTESTVGTEMFDVSVETAVRWSRQESDVPEHYRVAARWAAWRNEHTGMTPPGVRESRNNRTNKRTNKSRIATGMASAAPAAATGIKHSSLRSFRSILCVQYLGLLSALQVGRSMPAKLCRKVKRQLLQQMPQTLHRQAFHLQALTWHQVD